MFGSNLRNVSKMADFCIFIEFHKISKIFDLVSIISISIFYMKINLTSAYHCGVLFHGGSCFNEALVCLNFAINSELFYILV